MDHQLNPYPDKLSDVSGATINPATEEKQDAIIGNFALKLVEVGSVTYLGKAPIGSSTSSAVWQVKKIDETSGLVVTWADGNDLFDNIFDDYLTLSYS